MIRVSVRHVRPGEKAQSARAAPQSFTGEREVKCPPAASSPPGPRAPHAAPFSGLLGGDPSSPGAGGRYPACWQTGSPAVGAVFWVRIIENKGMSGPPPCAGPGFQVPHPDAKPSAGRCSVENQASGRQKDPVGRFPA
ncbi:unnamed protein product [Pleuronectes platessa]|uniref:Uncharacterized protein n=1 Tax=Pleuronectes platessa TaxID=8262 RepID=A0A9N7Z0U9_PLEPL|nr:unnamed protein product [Pleuronectes platessa]